jgi:hypothetical protein
METHEWRIKREAEQYWRRIWWVDVAQLAGLLAVTLAFLLPTE